LFICSTTTRAHVADNIVLAKSIMSSALNSFVLYIIEYCDLSPITNYNTITEWVMKRAILPFRSMSNM